MRKLLVVAAFFGTLVAAAIPALAQEALEAQRAPVAVRIIALNDFHGHLEGRLSGATRYGGVDVLAGYVDALRAGHAHALVVSAGDLIGASPLVSGYFHDEPTIEAMNRLGLDLSAVGNHEFDAGVAELLRMQHGGCHPQDAHSCAGRAVGTPYPFEGARFEFLAANVRDRRTGQTLFPGWAVRRFEGVPVAFIGMTLQGTAHIVRFEGIRELSFRNEARTVNELVPALRAQGIEAIVVLVHEGGVQRGRYDECVGISGPIVDLVRHLDDAVDLVVSGHTHEAYQCRLPNAVGRRIPVTSAGAYGRFLSAIDLRLDAQTGDVRDAALSTVEVRRDDPRIVPRAALGELVARYQALVAPVAQRVVGQVRAPFTRETDAAGESAAGRLVADAQLEATRAQGAQIAFMNPGGVRAGIGEGGADVTYADVHAAQPFDNTLVTLTLNGGQIKALLEQQFGCPGRRTRVRVLQVSAGFEYAWDAQARRCAKIDPQSMRLDGVVLEPAARYRVTVNSYLAEGGDGQWVLKKGEARVTGPLDRDALADYLTRHSSLAPGGPARIRRLH